MSAFIDTLREAFEAYEKKDFNAAEQRVSKALQDQPSHVDALHLGANIAHDRGDIATAHARLFKALEQAPDNIEMLNLMGLIMDDAHNPVVAQASFERALELDPDYQHARQNLAFHLLKTAQPDKAVAHFKNLVAAFPNSEKFKLGLVYALKDSEQGDAAIEILDTLSDDQTVRERAALAGQILFNLGKYQAAIEANNLALESRKHGPRALANTAQILHMLDQWPAADAFLTGMTSGPQSRADLSASAAKAYLRAGKYDDARRVIAEAVQRYSETPELLIVRAELGRLLGDHEQAYQDARAALTARPGQNVFMGEFAQCALVAGHVEDCMIAAESGLKQNPNDQFWIAMLATGGRLKGQNYKYYFDYARYVRVYDLEPPKGFLGMDAFNTALKKELESLHGFSSAPLDQSLRMGTQTSPDLRFIDSPAIQEFFKVLGGPIRDYMFHIGQDQKHPLTLRNTGKYRLASAWSVRLGAGGHHINHVHPEGWISSSYYVDVPDEVSDETTKAGWIQFGQPPLDIPQLTPEHVIEPKPGRLVLFPSYLWHGTIPITGGASRLTLPFDVLPA